jgi:hypothetical protein
MRCPFCQNEMGAAADACPRCHRRHSPQVARFITQGWNALQGGAEEEARAAFTQALQATPQNDKAQIQSYVAYLFTQAKAPPAAAAASVGSQSQSQAQLRSQPQAQPQARPQAQRSAPPQSATVSAPAPRQTAQPSAGAARRGLFFNFNERPVNIMRVMDDAKRQQAEYAKARTQRMRLVALLVPAGLPFICADVALGYNLHTFSLVALVLWGAALVGFIVLRRNRPTGQEFGPAFNNARAIFETLKDDLSPKRTLVGWLDLTGTQQASKIARQHTSTSGMPIAFYRDEWLRMKMPLYDGNVLRVSAIERAKARLGKWKTGRISGKRKWRPGGTVWAKRELRVAVTVNRDVYETLPIQPASQVGKYVVSTSQNDEGSIVLTATADQSVGGGDILQVLRFVYDHLKPRQTSTAAGGQ